jgi:fermentation-respiration switch protein FrsA (DUF1100 family)
LIRRVAKAIELLLIAAAAGYVGVTGLVWIFQEKLLFYPRPVIGTPAPPTGWKLEQVQITTKDGTRLAGVLVLPPVAKPPLVVYFGGNAEEVTSFASSTAETYGNRAVLLVNYRGYGDSEGSPGEEALVSDGAEVVDWASRRADIDTTRIVLHGRSLGGGVAVQVAAARPPRCVVLTTPFASAREVAQMHYRWLPVGWLIRHPFDSAARAPSLAMPVLILIGTADTLIAPSQSKRLAGLWKGPVQTLELEGYGHNDLSIDPRYDAAIHAFLDRCL